MVKHFTKKFAKKDSNSEIIQLATQSVTEKLQQLHDTRHAIVITEEKTIKYIKRLNLNCSPSKDGITAEHLLYSLDSSLPRCLARMLTLCLQYGVGPETFLKS